MGEILGLLQNKSLHVNLVSCVASLARSLSGDGATVCYQSFPLFLNKLDVVMAQDLLT